MVARLAHGAGLAAGTKDCVWKLLLALSVVWGEIVIDIMQIKKDEHEQGNILQKNWFCGWSTGL